MAKISRTIMTVGSELTDEKLKIVKEELYEIALLLKKIREAIDAFVAFTYKTHLNLRRLFG